MTDTAIKTIEHVRHFLNGVGASAFRSESRAVRYAWSQTLVVRFHYHQLGKAEKGLRLDFLQTGRGSSRIQGKRLSHHYLQPGQLQRRQRPVQGVCRLYRLAEIRVLAQPDEVHGTLAGPATKKRGERAWTHFGQTASHRLAGISVASLSILRHSTPSHRGRQHFAKPRPTGSSLGQRRHPHPTGPPGYLRGDTVPQGDFDGVKGGYPINAVDEVPPFDIVCSVETISDRDLLPVVEDLLDQFPVVLLAFQADKGSEYLNKHVVPLLNTRLRELPQSRARHGTDKALVDSTNGAIVRTQRGYGHIPQQWPPPAQRLPSRPPHSLQQRSPARFFPARHDGRQRPVAEAFSRRRQDAPLGEIHLTASACPAPQTRKDASTPRGHGYGEQRY